MLSRQLEEFGVPMVAGGLADQPMGYLADVQAARAYARAKEAVDREHEVDGQLREPAPEWAWAMVEPVRLHLTELSLRAAAGEDVDS